MGRHKRLRRDLIAKFFDPLLEVANSAEVAEMCHVQPDTVRLWCELGYIAARRPTAGRGWLISLPSVRDFMRREYAQSSRYPEEKRVTA